MSIKLNGNGLWESSRMMLPEHKAEIIKQMGVDTNMVIMKGKKRPTRDEFELEELGERLVEAKREEIQVCLTVWNWDEPAQGKIIKMDSRTKLVHIEQHGDITKIPFMDIMKVNNSDF